MAQLGPTVGVVKPGGGMNTYRKGHCCQAESFRPGRLVKALGHHMVQPNAMPVMQCTMQVYHLANQFRRENADVVVTNQ